MGAVWIQLEVFALNSRIYSAVTAISECFCTNYAFAESNLVNATIFAHNNWLQLLGMHALSPPRVFGFTKQPLYSFNGEDVLIALRVC